MYKCTYIYIYGEYNYILLYVYVYIHGISMYICMYMGYRVDWSMGKIRAANHSSTIQYADWISKMAHHPLLRLDMSSEIATLIDAWMLHECLFDDRREPVHVCTTS